MNNKKYYILYYICVLIMLVLYILNIYNTKDFENFLGMEYVNVPVYILGVINLVSVILFSIFLLKKKVRNLNNFLPVAFLIFLALVAFISTLFSSKLLYPLHFVYYFQFLLIGYTFINIYSLLSFDGNKKSKE